MTAPPRWDVSDLFPSLSSPGFAAAHEALAADVQRLVALHDRHAVGETEPRTPTPADVEAVDELLEATNRVQRQLTLVSGYVSSFVTTDSHDDAAQTVASRLLTLTATVRALGARFGSWVAALGADGLGDRSIAAAEHSYPL